MKKIILLFVISAGIQILPSQGQVNIQDSLALVDFYNSTNGATWTNSAGWLTAAPVSTWPGIQVTDNRVTSIGLSHNGLTGGLVSSFGNLTALTGLDLSRNALTGRIPNSIGNLVNLTSLKLYTNKFTDTIPASMGNLTNLTFLAIGGNQLTGSIPSSLGNLIKLSTFSLSLNQLTGIIPSSINNLVQMYIFELNNNKLTGSIPAGLGNFAFLSVLDLSHNQLTGSIPSELGNLANLNNLVLNNNKLTGSIPTSFGGLSSLQQLYLNNNQLSGSIPSTFGNITSNVGDFYLQNNQLSGKIPPSLGNLTGLEHLFLNNNQLSGPIPSTFGKLTRLQQLNLSNNQLSGTIPPSLDSLKNDLVGLYLLDLSNNRFTFAGMETLVTAFNFAVYAPQGNIPLHQNGNTFSVSAGGNLGSDTFRWYRNGVLSITKKGDSTFTPKYKGAISVAVTNKIATQLTLFSDTIESTLAEPDEALENIFSAKASIYPNPAKDNLDITLHATQNESEQIEIVNMDGKILLSQKLNVAAGNSIQNINVAKLAAGTYFVNIKSAEGQFALKFIKE